jgi:hypothetical protein
VRPLRAGEDHVCIDGPSRDGGWHGRYVHLDPLVWHELPTGTSMLSGEASQIGEHGPRAILSVEPQQGALLWDLMRCEVTCDRGAALAQFRAVASVAAVAKTAEPLVTMSLRNNCRRPDDQ